MELASMSLETIVWSYLGIGVLLAVFRWVFLPYVKEYRRDIFDWLMEVLLITLWLPIVCGIIFLIIVAALFDRRSVE